MDKRAGLLSLFMLLGFLVIWASATPSRTGGARAVDGYEALVAGADEEARLPGPGEVGALALEMLSDPFYDRGPNDKGIGLQLGYSIARVFVGYLLACIVAIPIGFVVGMSPTLMKALNPFIQVLKPISPLAWMPLALFVIEDSVLSSIFVIFVCSLWPILINTSFGVASVHRDYINVARTLELGRLATALRIILPTAAPAIVTGMRISIGISWLVIVAAEMLVGGTGVGYFVWNEWNNLDLSAVIVTIVIIGVVGMVLDFGLAKLAQLVSFQEA